MKKYQSSRFNVVFLLQTHSIDFYCQLLEFNFHLKAQLVELIIKSLHQIKLKIIDKIID